MSGTKAQLVEIVGEDSVSDHAEADEPFSLAHELMLTIAPRFTVSPRNVDQVQEIVRWANRTLTPLVPVSSSRPHLRGDSAPTTPEAISVDLSRMKRILKVDRRTRLALIEPGVMYGQLQPALQKEGLRIVMPLLPRRGKSVLASLLEREPVMSPQYQWSLLEPLRSLEVVWGNGDKVYSGGGTFRGEKEEDWRAGRVPLQGPGPGQLDFYRFISAAQGSMGIATWASVKCEVWPEFRELFFVPAEDLGGLIDFTYQLLKFRFGDELFIVNSSCLAYILSGRPDEVRSWKGALPAWTAVVGITGGHILPREKVQAQEQDIRDLAQRSGLEMVPAIEGCRGGELLELLSGPSEEPYWKLRYRGGTQEIFFLTTLDKTPGYLMTICAAADEHQYPAPDIGVYIQPVHQGTACHCEFMLPFDRNSRAERLRTRELFCDASLRLFRQGAFFSRPYGIWASMVYNADAQTMIATRKVKAIFDPNNVMNPGKLCL